MIRLLERVQEVVDTYKQQTTSTGVLSSNTSMTSLLNNQNNSLARLYARQRPNIFFRPISMHQLLQNEPPSLGYAKAYAVQNSELLYKIFKGDTKLVRSLLEAHDF
jgi:hypothetical protein